MNTVSESRFLDEWPNIFNKYKGKSISISYLPSSLKTSYMYIYIPSLDERFRSGSAKDFCLKADVQICVTEEGMYECNENKVISLSRVRFQEGRTRFCRLEALNLDPLFVARLFNNAVSVV